MAAWKTVGKIGEKRAAPPPRLDVARAGFDPDAEVHRVRGEFPGEDAVVVGCVWAETRDGRLWSLPCGHKVQTEDGFDAVLRRYHDGPELAARVQARGSIDPRFWVEQEEDTRTSAERAHDEWVREMVEDRGMGV